MTSSISITPIIPGGSQYRAHNNNPVNVGSNVTVVVPFGWKRDLVDGRVVYLSPSNCLLWSYEEIAAYLMTDGTCKCGLECPILIHEVFNFDPVPCYQRYPSFPDVNSHDQFSSHPNQHLCNHKRKIMALAAYQQTLMAEAQHVPSHHQQLQQNHFSQNPHQQTLEASGTQMIRVDHHQTHHHQQMNGYNDMSEKITEVTASITEVIPSVGPVPLTLNTSHPHHHQPQQAPLHYSLIVPQPMLISGGDQLLLSPQLVSSFSPIHHQPQHDASAAAAVLTFNPQHQQYQTHPSHTHLTYGQDPSSITVTTPDTFVKKRSRKKSTKKQTRTVAAILRLKS